MADKIDLSSLAAGIPEMPPIPDRDPDVPHAPKRPIKLSQRDFKVLI